MRTGLLPYICSFVWPAAFLLLGFCFVVSRPRLQARPDGWLMALGALAVGIVLITVGGIPLGRWFTGVCANLSLPLLALVIAAIVRRVFGAEPLGGSGTRVALWFGAVAGGLLYPMAMGLGSLDPYEAGWGFSWLFAGTGALAGLLLWRGNRFGHVLLAAIAAYLLGLLESENYWDYLVDPVYFMISLAALAARR